MKKPLKVLVWIVCVTVAIVILVMFFAKGIADVATDQLKSIKDGDYTKAYSYTSKDFQAASSIDDFKAFVDVHPSLKNSDDVTFSDRETQGDTGTLKGTMKSDDGVSTQVSYKLVKESGSWKILSIDLTAENVAQDNQSAIDHLALSDQRDENSSVNETKRTLVSSAEFIYLSAYIKNAVAGSRINAVLTCLGTNENVGPVSNLVDNEGQIISNFSFSKPTNGWPVGDYKVKVDIDGSASSEQNFIIE